MADEDTPNILTVRINIHDRSKLDWIWEGMRFSPKAPEGKKFADEHGFTVTMLSWGDPCGEKEYVLERIDKYMSRWDRDELLEDMGREYDSLNEIDQLQELIEIWTKEAREFFGMDTRHRDNETPEQLELKEQPGGTSNG